MKTSIVLIIWGVPSFECSLLSPIEDQLVTTFGPADISADPGDIVVLYSVALVLMNKAACIHFDPCQITHWTDAAPESSSVMYVRVKTRFHFTRVEVSVVIGTAVSLA